MLFPLVLAADEGEIDRVVVPSVTDDVNDADVCDGLTIGVLVDLNLVDDERPVGGLHLLGDSCIPAFGMSCEWPQSQFQGRSLASSMSFI
jgi:hypothetical protein